MKQLFCLALAAASGAAAAQTPAVNRMPDGSRDLYLGLGAVSAPRYEGARERKLSAWPVLQFEWSNGIFVSGATAGMHLSSEPSIEYGPLLSFQPRRSESGNASGVGGIDSANSPSLTSPPIGVQRAVQSVASGLDGMDPIGARLQAGGFFNVYLNSHLRLTNSLLIGSGNSRKGATWAIGVQQLVFEMSAHHKVALTAGATVANRDYNQAFFGVSEAESERSVFATYRAAAGVKDIHAGLHWNWAVAPAWIVTSDLRATRLAGSAKDSPLVQRPTNLTVSTALAYRF